MDRKNAAKVTRVPAILDVSGIELGASSFNNLEYTIPAAMAAIAVPASAKCKP